MEQNERMVAYQKAINQEPKKEWVKEYAESGAKYIPIGILQTQLDEIYDEWGCVSSSTMTEKNIVYDMTIWYIHPVTGLRIEKSGSGAMKIDGDINQLAPIAEAFSFKNACKKIGKRFGADLNREEVLEFTGNRNKAKLVGQ